MAADCMIVFWRCVRCLKKFSEPQSSGLCRCCKGFSNPVYPGGETQERIIVAHGRTITGKQLEAEAANEMD